jgi:hypothetical protein
MYRSNRLLLAVVAVILATADGCSHPPPPYRGPIRGTVTLDGKPLPKGNVRFIALEASGFNVLAPVTDGIYDVPEGQGLVKGKYRVEFSVPKAGRRVPNPDVPGAWMVEPEEALPVRYHRDSQMVMDYDPADQKPFNGTLTSR